MKLYIIYEGDIEGRNGKALIYQNKVLAIARAMEIVNDKNKESGEYYTNTTANAMEYKKHPNSSKGINILHFENELTEFIILIEENTQD